MTNAAGLYWLHALTPLHVGMGRGEGYIDLPVLREKVTHFPFVPGSTTKGIIADACGAWEDARLDGSDHGQLHKQAFGTAGNDLANSGALVFSDARLMCLPVRSLRGTFAWCTSPLVLRRFRRDLEAAGIQGWPDIPELPDDGTSAFVPCKNNGKKDDANKVDSTLGKEKIYLEDLDISIQACSRTRDWAEKIAGAALEPSWLVNFLRRFVVLPDEIFGFLAETATEVQAHIKIDPDFKRVVTGALWYEESLPAETILAGPIWYDPPRNAANGNAVRERFLGLLADRVVQMGGKATTGKGRIQFRFQTAVPGKHTGQPAANSDEEASP